MLSLKRRQRVCRTWIIVVLGFVCMTSISGADPMKKTGQLFPPLVPEGEVVLTPDPAFEAECMSEISGQARENRWQFRNSLLTKSEDWGIILRVDFDTPAVPVSSGFINRVICWRTPEESGNGPSGTTIAFGQRISPLGR
jgi:hypothetical protein